jgi:hypothetical protein
LLPNIALIDYAAEMKKSSCNSLESLANWFEKDLPYLFFESYLKFTNRETGVMTFNHGNFSYLFDETSMIANETAESRLVAAFGKSNPQRIKRDDARLRGWVGQTEKTFGKEYDKGHFIAHSIGGAVDGLEANVFVQKRDVNRGWNGQTKFRQMEQYCFENANTFCFSRPVYNDDTAKVKYLEFGIIKPDMTLWVEAFDN